MAAATERAQVPTPPPYRHIQILQFKAAEVSSDGQRIVRGYASTPQVDRQGEVILPTAFESSLYNYLQHPVVTWSHEWWDVPIGKTVNARVDERGLYVEIEIAKGLDKAEAAWTAIEQGLINSLSVGFDGEYTEPYGHWEDIGVESMTSLAMDATMRRRWIWEKLDLLEIAVVPIPANPGAQFQMAKSLGLAVPDLKAIAAQAAGGAEQERAAVAFADLPTAPEDTSWDAAGSEARVREWAGGPDKESIDWARYRKRFAWYDPDNAEDFGGYKLPIADVIDGELRAVWRGVAAAMGALLGSRGGVDIPDGDRKSVYNHLAKCYAKFDKEVPEFKSKGADTDTTAEGEGGEDDLPRSLSEVEFRAGELDIIEEQRALEDSTRLRNAATSLSNISRHWEKSGGVPSAEIIGPAVSAIAAGADVVRAGRVLSATNRSAVEQAIEALQDVLTRDDESRANNSAEKGRDAGAPSPASGPGRIRLVVTPESTTTKSMKPAIRVMSGRGG